MNALNKLMQGAKDAIAAIVARMPSDDPATLVRRAEQLRADATKMEKGLDEVRGDDRDAERLKIYRMHNEANRLLTLAEEVAAERAKLEKERSEAEARLNHEGNLATARKAYKAAAARMKAAVSKRDEHARVLAELRTDLASAEVALKKGIEDASERIVAAKLAGKAIPAGVEGKMRDQRDALAAAVASAEKGLSEGSAGAEGAAQELKEAEAAFYAANLVHQQVLLDVALEDFNIVAADFLVAEDLAVVMWREGAVHVEPPNEVMESALAKVRGSLEA